MPKPLFHIFLFVIASFSFACNREKVNLEGRWEIVQAEIPKVNRDVRKDSVSQFIPHFSVGNRLDFTAGELTMNRKGTNDSVYYGFAYYKVANDGRTVRIDAGNYKPLTFQLKNLDDDRVELWHKMQNVKVQLKPYEEED